MANVAVVDASGKKVAQRELAAEVLTGEADTDGYTNGHMERGKQVEEEAPAGELVETERDG